MKQNQSTSKTPANKGSREDRLKAALKANLGRRKAQAKARTTSDAPNAGTDTETNKG